MLAHGRAVKDDACQTLGLRQLHKTLGHPSELRHQTLGLFSACDTHDPVVTTLTANQEDLIDPDLVTVGLVHRLRLYRDTL